MAKKFTDLPELTSPASEDVLAIVDTSANVSKRITLLNLLTNFIDAVHLKANSVITSKILDGAVTAAKIETQEAWIVPTLLNSWVRYDLTYAEPRYYKDSLGIVHMNGMLKNGTLGVAAFVLPAGYRPGAPLIFAGTSNNLFGQLRVGTNGNVVMQSGSATWFSLDNITFRAEA